MNYSLNQAAYELLDLYRTSLKRSDDIDLRELKAWIRLHRSLWLRNEYNKNRDIDDSVEQDLGAVEMKYIDATFKPSVTPTGVIMSSLPIPTTIEMYDRPCFTRVAPYSRQEQNLLPFVPITRFPMLGTGRFNSNQLFAFQYNNYIGVYCRGTNDLLADIISNGLNVTGVFEDFTQAARFPELGDNVGIAYGYSTTKYYDDDKAMPLHDWMLQYMKQELMQGEATIAAQLSGMKGNL